MRRLGAAILAAAVCLLAAPRLAASARTPTREQLVQELLDRRARAFRERDRTGFLDTVDPQAASFRDAQASLFDNLGDLRLSTYELALSARFGDFTRRSDRARYGVPVLVADVEERLGIEGFDEHPAANDLYLTFVDRGGRWLVASDSDLDGLGLLSSREPWDFGPVRPARSDHFLVLAHPQDESFAPQALSLAEAAMPAVGDVWRRPWSQKVPIFIPHDRRELEALMQATFDVSNFVAFAVATVDRRQGWSLGGVRIILNRSNFEARPPEGRRSVFTHELLHVATRSYTGPFIVSFVEEGLAEMAAGGSSGTPYLAQQIRSGHFDGRLPQDSDFVSGSQDDIYLAYQKATSAMMFLRKRFGIDALDRLYESYGAARVEPGTSTYHLERVLSEVFGLSPSELQREWAAYAPSAAGSR